MLERLDNSLQNFAAIWYNLAIPNSLEAIFAGVLSSRLSLVSASATQRRQTKV